MSRSACPTPEELSRQVSLGPDGQLSAHLDDCESCANTFSSESSLVGMFQSLSFGEPSMAQVSNVRQGLLRQTAPSAPVLKLVPSVRRSQPQRVWAVFAAAAAIALVVGASWWLSASSSIAPTLNKKELTLAQVQSSEATYKVTGSVNDEIVRLQDGTVTVQVQHLAPGQRFRVITGDAEVEVRGTKFDVIAKDDKLVKVLVYEGKVEVRAAQGAPTLLLPNQTWDIAAQAPISSASTQATTLASTQEPETKEGPKNKTNTPKPKDNAKLAEEAFTKGVEQMTAKDYEGAAESFSQVTSLAPSSALSEDARYFYAFALLRGGQKAKAKSAFISFMAKYPNASRRGEAAVALGQLYLESGELDEAQIMFESATDDPSDAVKKSAAGGLSTIAKQRRTPPSLP